MSSLFWAPLRAIRFISFQVRSFCLALLLCLSISIYADTRCGDDALTEALLPDYGFVADWGIRVNQLAGKDYNWQDVEVQQRPEIEYEQDVRVTYDQEAVSITSFWQGCESFIGKQEQCESDESLSIVVTPDQLNDTLLAQGSLVTNSYNNITSFPEPNEGDWQVSDNPILEEIFNISMTESEIDALDDFTQLGFRQAIRITADVGKPLEQINFNELQLPLHIITSKEGLFVESKVILKAFFISDEYAEQVYKANRSLLEENLRTSYCSENTCGFEFLISDFSSVDQIHKHWADWSGEGSICFSGSVLTHVLSAYRHSYTENTEVEKVIFHYEIQTSIINSKEIENFSTLDYMDRDLTLPKEKSGGSLYYLLLMLLLITLFKETHSNHQRIDEIIKGF